jgi:hypothetical protein
VTAAMLGQWLKKTFWRNLTASAMNESKRHVSQLISSMCIVFNDPKTGLKLLVLK